MATFTPSFVHAFATHNAALAGKAGLAAAGKAALLKGLIGVVGIAGGAAVVAGVATAVGLWWAGDAAVRARGDWLDEPAIVVSK